MIVRVENKLISIFFIMFSILFGCENNTLIKQCNIDHKLINSKKIEDITIDVIGLQYKHEQAHSAYYDDANWYIGLDQVRNSLDFFDLTNKKFVKSILIKNDGSEGGLTP